MNWNPPAAPPPPPPPPPLPPGIRFDPTGNELVQHFLRHKVLGLPFNEEAITEMDIYQFHPDHLPIFLESPDGRYAHFFMRRASTEPTWRWRFTPGGYWNEVGVEEAVRDESSSVIVGFKRKFVFFEGTNETRWEMDEYRINQQIAWMRNTIDLRRNNYVICKVYMESLQSSGDLSFSSEEAQQIGSDETDSSTVANKRKRN